ncbi:MAG: hypothetical protein MJE12_19485 [Alphaproteobacteria bacterium]|nr:hypothetical protein [Alphaproteobacteria bacterium]
MSLAIDTFSNVTGGFSFFKAVGHPSAAKKAAALIADLAQSGPAAVYDPLGFANAFAALHDCAAVDVAATFVQDLATIGDPIWDHPAAPVTDLPGSGVKAVFVVAFDADRLFDHIRHLLPEGAAVFSLDAMRLDDERLTNRRRYLDPLNFATNFAFFRDADGHHTRLVTANYWAGYGAKDTRVWYNLFDDDGEQLAEWCDALEPTAASIVVDSRAVRDRFGLADFTGQLFLHVVNGAGHDVVKYALDTYGDDDTVLSCTHDANAWPADLYGGLPAPAEDETVILWVQNSHPCPIPRRSIGLNRMGQPETAWLDREIPPYGSHPVDVAALLPDVAWPEQIEVTAGKHFVRPRYEILTAANRRRIAHANVERTDLAADPQIPELGNLLGKAYLLPAPILPTERYRSIALPTPMSTAQSTLPLTAILYDARGHEVARHRFGCLPRDHAAMLDIDTLLAGNGAGLADGYGHMELVYDFDDGGTADGWLHGLFRYEDRESGHAAETSFGAHIFNTVLTYRNEPQSYAGPAPGLSTRLFLRLGPPPLDTLCHLIYPASTPWHAASETVLHLHDGSGEEIANRPLAIPCGGSVHWRYAETFSEDERRHAGPDGYVIIRDVTCRLFGYHGLISGKDSFSLDHMFGF